MKRLINASKHTLSKLPILEEISVFIDADITQYVQSADLIDQGVLEDTQVVAEWHTFLDTVMLYITTHEQLELLHDEPGDKLKIDSSVPGSYYYYIGVKNTEDKFIGQVVVDFRLSTHESTNTSAKERIKHEADALEIIQKEYPNANTLVPKQLIVNKKQFHDYDTAKLAIVGMMDSIIQKYSH